MDKNIVWTNILIENCIILIQICDMLAQYKKFATNIIAHSLEYFLCSCFNYTTVVKVIKLPNTDKPL